ncbi:MAG: hypothetical protein K8R88_12740, partial [Armatimonadetes bacterium]|nr:hypothetical protein [Armatimonadota bacterium]
MLPNVSDDYISESELNYWPMCFGVLASLIVGGAINLWLASLTPRDGTYGVWLFTFVPGCAGLAAGIATNWKRDHNTVMCWVIALLSYALAVAITLISVREGVICAVLAAPLVIPLHAFGYYLGSEIMAAKRTYMMVTLAPLLLLGMAVNARQTPAAETRTETTVLDIDAGPEKIWPLLFELPSIAPPAHILFRAGVAHPAATHSAGRFVGAGRECVLTTGTMNERIVALEPGKRLKFEVLNTPPPMKELNPFGEV